MPGVDIMPLRGRPLNIQTLPRSLAGHKYRTSEGGWDPTPDNSADAGHRPSDLFYHGGKTIPNLTFTNFYLNGDAWEPSDIENIDRTLAAAMREPSLNNVLAQYFNTVPTSRFVPSQKLAVSIASEFTEDNAEEVIRNLKIEGKLSGFDLSCTAIVLFVPRGIVISLGPDNSRNGLSCYHSSVEMADVTIYYTVIAYSETLDGKANGFPVFDVPWKSIAATTYHQLNEIRTDPDIRKVINTGENSLLGWMSTLGRECGDVIHAADSLREVFQEVPLPGGGTAPVQFMYSNYVHGPEGPIPDPHPSLLKQIGVSNSSSPDSAITSEEKNRFTWVLSEGTRIPGEFSVGFVDGYEPTTKEKECLNRVNKCVADLVAITDDGTPRSQQSIANCDADLQLLRECVQKLVAGEMTVESLLFITYKYEGKFEELRASLDSSKFTVKGSPDPQNTDMLIGVHIGRGKATKEQLDLKRELDKAVTVVKCVMQDRPTGRFALRAAKTAETHIKRHEYIQQLVGIGRVGLMDGDIELAKVTLETLKDEFVAREAAAVKNYYVRRLGIWAFVFTVAFATVYAFIGDYWENFQTANLGTNGLYRFRNFLPLAIGASTGAWLAFLIRRPVLGFSDLVQLDDDLLNPVTRVVFTIVLSLVIGVLFWTGMVAITVGEFSTKFEDDGLAALLIGAFCGIASRALAMAVSRRAEDFAGNVGGTGGLTAEGGKGVGF